MLIFILSYLPISLKFSPLIIFQSVILLGTAISYKIVMDSITISKVTKVLSEEHVVVQNWKKLFDSLILKKADSVSLADRFNIGLINPYELFREILEQWVEMQGRAGTIGVLVDILSRDGFKNAAGIGQKIR